jgi:capsular polysaccharide biosynthesis protein
MDIRRLIQAVQAKKWLFLAVFAVALGLLVILPQATTQQYYLSTARILVTPANQANGTAAQEGASGSTKWLTNEATLRELVTSERLVGRVLQLAKRTEKWTDIKEHVVLEPLTQGFSQDVTLFSLGLEDTDPQKSKMMSELLAKEFVSYVEELSAREFANTRRFLEELVAESKERVEATEDKLLNITAAKVSSSDENKLVDSQDELETERRTIKTELLTQESELQAVSAFLNGSVDTPPWAVIQQGDSSLKSLETAASEAKLKLLELEQLYRDDNQLVQAQRAKLAKIQGVYDTRLNSYVRALRNEKAQVVADRRTRLASLDNRIRELRNRQLSIEEKREASKLERQLEMWEENYLGLVKQLYQARILEQASRRQGAITIIQPPYEGLPVKGKARRNLAQALAFGLPFSVALAVGAVLAADYFHSSLRVLPKIEARLGLQVLAVVPTVPAEVAEVWESYKREETMPRAAPENGVARPSQTPPLVRS